MNTRREIIFGGLLGVTFGLILRCVFAERIPFDETLAARAPSPVAIPQSVEIRQETAATSAEAQAAVENGEVKFIISGQNSSDTGVARILLELGSLPIYQAGNVLCIWKQSESQWTTARNAGEFSGYSIGRAWTLPNPSILGKAATVLPSSAEVFLLLPTDEEMRVVGAVEQALRPSSLSDYCQIELTLEKTPGGHIRWELQRALRRDKTETCPKIILPI